MRKMIIGLLAVGFVSTGAWMGCSQAADEAAPAATPAAPAAPAATRGDPRGPGSRRRSRSAGCRWSPGRRSQAWTRHAARGTRRQHSERRAEKSLTDPAKLAAIADEGHQRYLSSGCNGCHGGGGGGGMCPPLTNDTWVYGAADDTLFRLITLGSDGLNKAGYSAPQARGRGRADATLRRIIKTATISGNHRLHPLGEPELDETGRRTLRTKPLLSVSSNLSDLTAKLWSAWRPHALLEDVRQFACPQDSPFCATLRAHLRHPAPRHR